MEYSFVSRFANTLRRVCLLNARKKFVAYSVPKDDARDVADSYLGPNFLLLNRHAQMDRATGIVLILPMAVQAPRKPADILSWASGSLLI